MQKQAQYGEQMLGFPPLDGPNMIDLGNYVRPNVSNAQNPLGRSYFDLGLRLMFSYQHEMAFKCFLACLEHSPYCVLAHGFVALCHSPNCNFKGEAYYESAHHISDMALHDLLCVFPSQQVADRHSKAAIDKIEYLRKLHKKQKSGGKGKKKGKGKQQPKKKQTTPTDGSSSNGNANEDQGNTNGEATDQSGGVEETPQMVSDVELKLLMAIRTLCCQPGVSPGLSVEMVGRPYADSMRKIYEKYPDDPEVAYCFAESLMVLNAWQLYEYPTGRPVSPDVTECGEVSSSKG